MCGPQVFFIWQKSGEKKENCSKRVLFFAFHFQHWHPPPAPPPSHTPIYHFYTPQISPQICLLSIILLTLKYQLLEWERFLPDAAAVVAVPAVGADLLMLLAAKLPPLTPVAALDYLTPMRSPPRVSIHPSPVTNVGLLESSPTITAAWSHHQMRLIWRVGNWRWRCILLLKTRNNVEFAIWILRLVTLIRRRMRMMVVVVAVVVIQLSWGVIARGIWVLLTNNVQKLGSKSRETCEFHLFSLTYFINSSFIRSSLSIKHFSHLYLHAFHFEFLCKLLFLWDLLVVKIWAKSVLIRVVQFNYPFLFPGKISTKITLQFCILNLKFPLLVPELDGKKRWLLWSKLMLMHFIRFQD